MAIPVHAPPGKISFQQFLEWLDEVTRAEWVDGEIEIMSPVSDEHHDLSSFFIALFRFFVEARQSGRVLTQLFLMKIGPDLSAREPDVMFVAADHLERIRKTYLDGPADLVIEIISPESIERDQVTKLAEYQQGGVSEYWTINPLNQEAVFRQLQENNLYRVIPVGEDGIYRSMAIEGLWLRVEWLWQRPLPSLLSVLQQWGLMTA